MKQKMFTNPISLTQDEKKKEKNHNPSKKLSLSFTVQFKLEKETAPDKV